MYLHVKRKKRGENYKFNINFSTPPLSLPSFYFFMPSFSFTTPKGEVKEKGGEEKEECEGPLGMKVRGVSLLKDPP
jgi:hypothetical protein